MLMSGIHAKALGQESSWHICGAEEAHGGVTVMNEPTISVYVLSSQ